MKIIKVKYNFSLKNYINHFEFLEKIMERAKVYMENPSTSEKSLLAYWYNKTETEYMEFGDIRPEFLINDVQVYSICDYPNYFSLIKVVNQDFFNYLKTQPNLYVKNYNVQLLYEFKPPRKVFDPNEEYHKFYQHNDKK
jgi:hypothetical protein